MMEENVSGGAADVAWNRPDVIDDEVFEVLAGVAWVREALAEFSPSLDVEDQRDVLYGLKTFAA